ncbi:MAG: ATP synthase F1 subunit gamma [Deltaproteobacteria bacterium]|nr:ATP synthase F1 subunit gamma [Deltaproteobacteria bacterium]MBW1951719.1 ATP synthase F1 subunit gamma [Deltaproteobacteria bacterium]MBW1987259.1 ATP synthase F1 subunit gamma [Deltaproteobacteria bacterium]MBW2134732.1 ATP synthase F1 subunit gamma [Deltaproteobacteria bacterium]
MATLRDIKRKIGAVQKTQQITKAMNMVAAAKLRGAQARMEQFRPYAAAFSQMLSSIAGRVEPEAHPFFVRTPLVEKIELVLLTADRGLCGSFNMNLITAAEKFVKAKEADGIEVSLTCVGRKGRDFFRRRKANIRMGYVDVWNKFDFNDAIAVAREVVTPFNNGEVQEVYLIYSEFVNMAIQRPTLVQLLPISPEVTEEEGPAQEYLCEPPEAQFLDYLLPRYINVRVYHGFLENSTSEHAARMTAMDNASSNCKDMIQQLTLVMNKARQAAITKELMDIIGGAEALKG